MAIVQQQQQQEQESQQQQQEQGSNRSKLVQRLLSANPNLPVFISDLLTAQAVVVAGTEAAGFIIERGEENKFSLRPVAHIRPDQADAQTRAAAIQAFQNILQPCVQQGKDGAVEIGSPDSSGETQFCLATLLRSEGQVVAISAVITRCLNVERARQRLTSMQLVAGYFELYSLRRSTEQTRLVAQSHQHVLQLAAAVGQAEGFEAAGTSLCNELATRTGALRVSLGWVKGTKIKVRALSHTEKFDKKQELIVQLQRVMEECLDQEEVVQYDPDGSNSQNVTREAQSLARLQGAHAVLSLPLRRKGEIVGVVTLEFGTQQRLTDQTAQGLAVAVDLLAPQLYDRHANDQWLIVKTGHSLRDLGAKAIGPKYMIAKTITVALILLLAFVMLYRPMYRISAPFQFLPVERRSLAAPFDGVIESLGKIDGQDVVPGMRVAQGTLLLRMDTYELTRKYNEALARAQSAALEAAKYRAEPGRMAEARIAEAQRDAAQAEADLYDFQIKQASITAPLDGEILKNDLRDKKGAPVKQGEVLFELAPPGELRVELVVAERDIQDLLEAQRRTDNTVEGALATTSMPDQKFKLRIERIVPLGEAKEGSNVFKVYAMLADAPGQAWMAGLQGEARVEIKPKPLYQHYTRRLTDFLTLWWWKWVA